MGKTKIEDAQAIIKGLGLPNAQQNERTALCLLALCDMQADKGWQDASNPLIGITPIMDWIRLHYQKNYAPNTRETIRRQSMHQMVDAGFALYNPDDPSRAVNSPKAVYQISPELLTLLKTYGSDNWEDNLTSFLETTGTLSIKYAKERAMQLVPVTLATGNSITFSPGTHSELIKAAIEDFAPRFVPGSTLIYAGDTGEKWGYFDEKLAAKIGINVDGHGKMPDVILYYTRMKWLVLVEAVTSHGPVDGKRHEELKNIFAKTGLGIVYVTAFLTRTAMSKYCNEIAWETEVWVAEAPTHLIHFNGERFLGPYSE